MQRLIVLAFLVPNFSYSTALPTHPDLVLLPKNSGGIGDLYYGEIGDILVKGPDGSVITSESYSSGINQWGNPTTSKVKTTIQHPENIVFVRRPITTVNLPTNLEERLTVDSGNHQSNNATFRSSESPLIIIGTNPDSIRFNSTTLNFKETDVESTTLSNSIDQPRKPLREEDFQGDILITGESLSAKNQTDPTDLLNVYPTKVSIITDGRIEIVENVGKLSKLDFEEAHPTVANTQNIFIIPVDNYDKTLHLKNQQSGSFDIVIDTSDSIDNNNEKLESLSEQHKIASETTVIQVPFEHTILPLN